MLCGFAVQKKLESVYTNVVIAYVQFGCKLHVSLSGQTKDIIEEYSDGTKQGFDPYSPM